MRYNMPPTKRSYHTEGKQFEHNYATEVLVNSTMRTLNENWHGCRGRAGKETSPRPKLHLKTRNRKMKNARTGLSVHVVIANTNSCVLLLH